MKNIKHLFIVFACLGLLEIRAQNIRRVTTTGTDSNDGSSWTNPMSLHAAISASSSGDQIWIAKGSYVPQKLQDGTTPPTGDERDVTFNIPDGVNVFGGFAGTEGSLTERDMSLLLTSNKTTLSGERGDNSDDTDNVKGIVLIEGPASGVPTGVTLNGIAIEKGYGGADGKFGGAGIFAGSEALLTVENCSFSDNNARRSGFLGGLGGAIYMAKGSITNTSFTNNLSQSNGGGVYLLSGTTNGVTITSSTFTGNQTEDDGGAVYIGGGTNTISESVFTGNQTDADGGAVYIGGGTNTISESVFTRNAATTDDGGAVYIGGGTNTLNHNTFTDNTAADIGAAIFTKGGTNTIYNSVFTRNIAIDLAGAIYIDSDDTITHCTFIQNEGNERGGGAIWTHSSANATIANSIFYGNTIAAGSGSQIYQNARGMLALTHNIIQDISTTGVNSVVSAMNTIDASSLDGIFANSTDFASNEYLRLKIGSPAIDAGNNDYLDGNSDSYMAGEETGLVDLDGNERLVGTNVDLGVYEFSAPMPVVIDAPMSGGSISTTSTGATATLTHAQGGTIYWVVLASSATAPNATQIRAGQDASDTNAPTSGNVAHTTTANTVLNIYGLTASTSYTVYALIEVGSNLSAVFTSDLMTMPTVPVTRRVTTTGTDSNDGSSWTNPMSLHAAISASSSGDQIWIAKGSYVPQKLQDGTTPPTGDERDVTFNIPDGVKVYGGFVGTETTLAQRDMSLLPTSNKTTLSGERGDNSDDTDNVKGIVLIEGPASGVPTGVTLNGIAIEKGYGGADGKFGGAGIFAGSEALLTVENCSFSDNNARRSGFLGGLGGAIYMAKGSITNTSFTNNLSQSNGGGVYLLSGTTNGVTITSSTFTGNQTEDDGGAVYIGGGTNTISESVFTGNQTDADGGAVYIGGGTNTISESVFTRNAATTDDGGAVYIGGGTNTLNHNTFTDNTAADIGAAIFTKGGTNTIYNSVFTRNIAIDLAGAIYIDSDDTITHCTFIQNEGNERGGGAIWTHSSANATIANSIFYGNTIAAGSGSQIYQDARGMLALTHNIIQDISTTGVNSVVSAMNTIDASSLDSIFANSTDPSSDEYLRLKTGSPAIDAGNNDYLDGNADSYMAGEETGLVDLDENERLVGTNVDLGVYEFSALMPVVIDAPMSGGSISTTSTGATATLTHAQGGTIYWVVLASSATAPNATQIRAGQDASDTNAPTSGNVVHTTTANTVLNISGLTASTSYTVYALIEVGSNLSSVFTSDLMTMPTVPATRRVTTTGTDSNDGSSWTNPMSLHAAISASSSGDQIWIAKGSYVPQKLQDGTTPPTGDERDVTFNIPDGVNVFGGFAGTEGSLTERDMSLLLTSNKTTLSGERGDNSDDTDNVKGIVLIEGPASGVPTGVTLNGIAIEKGYGGAKISHNSNDGAGMYVSERGSLKINYCIFTNNTVVGSGAVGGAISVTVGGYMNIRNTIFNNNRAMGSFSSGGAIYIRGMVEISNGTFVNNRAPSGGAVYVGSDGIASLANSIVISNFPSNSQLRQQFTGTFTISHNLIERGSAGIQGSIIETSTVMANSPNEVFASRRPSNQSYLQLKENSPAIDAGSNDYLDGDSDTYMAGDETGVVDLLGNPRLKGTKVDIGAYEYDPANISEIDDFDGILRVKPMPSGTADGSSWDNSMSLHAALQMVIPGDSIWIAKGTYMPNKLIDGTNPGSGNETDATFLIPHSTVVYGGFLGTEASIMDRNISMLEANNVILSGDIGVANDRSDNVKNIVYVEGSAVLDGLTIKNGNGGRMLTEFSEPTNGGAGIIAPNGTNLKLNNCTLTDNMVVGNTSIGGAVYTDGIIEISNSIFRNNRAQGNIMKQGYGGAIYINESASASIAQSIFAENDIGDTGSNGEGGAIYVLNSNGTIITHCNFINNSATMGGGILIGRAATATIANSIFFSNTITGSSGSQIAKIGSGNVIMTNNIIENGSDTGISVGISTTVSQDNLIDASSLDDIFANSTDFASNEYLRLKTGSPAIDAGNNDYLDGNSDSYMAGEETGLVDLDGNERLVGTNVDLGVYEFSAPMPVVIDAPMSGGSISTTSTGATATLTHAQGGTIYWVVLASSATAPNATQIRAGQDASDTNAPTSGNVAHTTTANTVLNISGLTASTSYTVYALIEVGSNLSAVFTSEVFSTTPPLGVEDGFSFSFYPNPASDFLTVHSNDNYQFSIYANSGQLVIEKKMSIEITDIDLRSLRSGIYLMKIIDKSNKIRNYKLLIRK